MVLGPIEPQKNLELMHPLFQMSSCANAPGIYVCAYVNIYSFRLRLLATCLTRLQLQQ